MTNESISSKLSDLFELHKSGALTKEEYEKLKKQILSEDGVQIVEPEKKQEQETVKTHGKPIRVKKGRKIWIITISAVVVMVVAFLVFKTETFTAITGLTLDKSRTVKDIDGNVYHTVTIGTQVWMVENLRTTKYNDGTAIPLVTNDTAWDNLTTPGYCWFNHKKKHARTYGALYNWYTLETGNLCPTGWHVPTDAEWTTLSDYLTNNGYGYEGSGTDIAKSMANTSGWETYVTPGLVGNDQASNNSSGFTALPSGFHHYNGSFIFTDVGVCAIWWSSTEDDIFTTSAYYREVNCGNNYVYRGFDQKGAGYSVRCLRDF